MMGCSECAAGNPAGLQRTHRARCSDCTGIRTKPWSQLAALAVAVATVAGAAMVGVAVTGAQPEAVAVMVARPAELAASPEEEARCCSPRSPCRRCIAGTRHLQGQEDEMIHGRWG